MIVMSLSLLYTGVFCNFTPKIIYVFYLTINLNVQVYIDHEPLYSMQNKETNPTVGNDDKKEEPKKEETAKKEK